MSYEIIKSIKVKEGKVFVSCASSNCWPRNFDEFESKSLTRILQEEGREALDVAILEQYENGNFQKGSNRYIRALKVLRHMPEYFNFDWRRSSFGDDDPIEKNRKSPAYKELLRKAMKTQLPKDKFVVVYMHYQKPYYVKFRRNRILFRVETEKATIFRYEQEAKNAMDWIPDNEVCHVLKLAA